MSTKEDKEIKGVEELNTLPVNDPHAGYLAPKPEEGFQTGELPDVEQDALDAKIEEWQEQAQAIKESEQKALEEREKLQAEDAETVRKWQEEHGLIPPAAPELPSEKAAAPKAPASKTASGSS